MAGAPQRDAMGKEVGMNRRPITIFATSIVVAVLGIGLLTACIPPPGNGTPTPLPTRTAAPSAPASSGVATGSQAPACANGTSLVAVRATAADTGFPIPVEWSDPALGPADDLFFTLSDVAPTIPLDPLGPASLTLGLNYSTGGEFFSLTAGAVDLAYDPGTGAVSGAVATGYGKDSRTAFPDPLNDPSRFDGTLIHPDGSGANGRLDGRITRAGRQAFHFVVEMKEICSSTTTNPTPEP